MPKDKETSNHPCHFLSLPSARRFWCRHCMSVFEDAITRWRHSRTCRYGVVSNFMRRRELEAKALQNSTKTNPIEARLEQSVEIPTVSSADESVVEGEASTNQNNEQEDKGALFRCFICHSQFSSLEEMRHHVKFPCNHKKVMAEDNQAAMTVYIDEFTDRSRPWDPAPQPQQEEVYTSEFVPSMETHQGVHTNLEVTAPQEDSIISTPQLKKQDNITPTNIYVNEQGETVIEVENLDLNSEGGELSLAHLLTQLSQQGIVFDKSKTGQMQARPEMTVSDPSSGKIYTTTSALNYPSAASGVKAEEDEGQPTAEDAANTLAQLAGFRGFRGSQELYEETQIFPNQSTSEQHIIQTDQGYTYDTSVTEATVSGSQMSINVQNSQPQINYQYEYYPATQASPTSTGQHIAIQSMVQPGTQESDNVKIEEEIVGNFPVHFYEERPPSHGVTYITTQDGQHPDATSMQTLESENISVEGQRVIIDHSSGGPVIIQQYGVGDSGSKSQQFVNFPVPLPNVSEVQNSTQEIFHSEQHSGQPLTLNKIENSEQVLCNNEAQGLTINNSQAFSHTIESNSAEPSETSLPSDQICKISNYSISDKDAENINEEFAIQTVSLQEIVEAESSNSLTFVDKSGSLSTQNSISNNTHHHVIHPVENNHLHSASLDNSSNQSLIHNVSVSGSLNDPAVQPDIALANKYVITESQTPSSLGPSTVRQSMPIFVVSSSGLQLVTSDQKNVVTEAQSPDL